MGLDDWKDKYGYGTNERVLPDGRVLLVGLHGTDWFSEIRLPGDTETFVYLAIGSREEAIAAVERAAGVGDPEREALDRTVEKALRALADARAVAARLAEEWNAQSAVPDTIVDDIQVGLGWAEGSPRGPRLWRWTPSTPGSQQQRNRRNPMRKPSRAVIAAKNGYGVVLWYEGDGITNEIEEAGLRELSDLGLDDAPDGISVWEGDYFMPPGAAFMTADVAPDSPLPKGKFVSPTDDDLKRVGPPCCTRCGHPEHHCATAGGTCGAVTLSPVPGPCACASGPTSRVTVPTERGRP